MNTRRAAACGRTPHVLSLAVLLAAIACGPAAAPEETPAQLEARARDIHARVITLDTHKDISGNFAPTDGSDGEDPNVHGTRQVDLPQMREGGLDVVFFIVYVGQRPELNDEGYSNALGQAMAKFDGIHRMTDELYGDQIGLARSAADAERLVAEGKLVAAIGIENGYPMGEDLSLIGRFKELGAGYMGITHNGHNQLGDSNTPADEPVFGGLSELGRQAVMEMNRQGIMVDVSHAGKQTMMEVLQVSQAPVIASHSSVAALRDHARNLDDEQLLALKENGGVMQTVAFSSYVKDPQPRNDAIAALRAEMGLPAARGRGGRGGGLGGRGGGRAGAGGPGGPGAGGAGAGRGAGGGEQEQGPQITPEQQAEFDRRVREEIDPQFPAANVHDFVDHIDYAVNLIGIDHVGISSDFDGGGGLEGWNNASESFNVTHELVKRGYTEEQIGKLWSGNLLRVWREVEAVGQRLRNAGGM